MIRRREAAGLLSGAERAGVNVDAEVAALVRDALAEKTRKASKGVTRRLSRHGYFRKDKKAEPISESDLRRTMQAAGSSEEESLATATLLSTFALLRAEECLALNVWEVTFETRHEVDVVRLSIRGSKTDQNRVGATRRVGCAQRNTTRPCAEPACAVHRLHNYMCRSMREVRVGTACGSAIFVNGRGDRLEYKEYLDGMRDTSSLEKDYLDGVARSQEYRHAYAMLSGVYDGA
ncbi:hypothetical protein FOZ60_005907 [Perkinsus olseni]|uniref:Tyr recombinase domain-containing protein n=1 Tax=Perkinsus olseni TaxID=32597 RepID=A0A7J6NQ58_PEROL|nr:hypothetical protein FOZ60_005907 [Perkinsus olseni]